MATSRSTTTTHLKERKVPSSSSAHSGGDTLHGRPSPKSSLPSSPERDQTTRLTQNRPRTSPAGSISRTAKNPQPSSATAAPNRRPTVTKKPSDQKPLSSSLQTKPLSSTSHTKPLSSSQLQTKPLSSSLQPKPSSTSHTSRQPSSATVKERAPRTSSSSLVRAGASSKPITGTSKMAKTVRSGTSHPSARAKSTGSIAKDKETSVKPPSRSTSEEPIAVPPEPEEHEEEPAADHDEANDSISISSPKDNDDSDDTKHTLEISVSEAVDSESLPELSEEHDAKPLEQEPEPALDDDDDDDGSHEDGIEEHGDDIDQDPEEGSDEKQDVETVEEQKEEPEETEQNPVADAEEAKEPSAEPIAMGEPEKETVEQETEKTAVRVMTFKKPEVVQGWKNDTPKNNEVLEETRSKLMERKKSKVLALVGAFETVMSLQEPDGQTQENSESKEVKKEADAA